MKGLQPCLATQCLPFTLVGLSVTVRAQWTQRSENLNPSNNLGEEAEGKPAKASFQKTMSGTIKETEAEEPRGLL